jgi:hypothetical protein
MMCVLMGSPRQFALLAIMLAAYIARGNHTMAQIAIAAASAPVDQSATGASLPQSHTSTMSVTARSASDQTLEIAPRIAPKPPATLPDSAPDSGPTLNDTTAPSDVTKGVSQSAPSANPSRPYLGIAVQTIYSNDRPGGLVNGLEVVSVDHDSPAANAGLHGRGKMTSVGESGATVGALMPPLNLLVMPLLKKTGSLGEGGDLIVAIDDRRVANDLDLQSELESLKPGDTIYLTIVRSTKDGSQQKLKLPIKLGDATKAVANADDVGDPQPPSSSAGAPAKQP